MSKLKAIIALIFVIIAYSANAQDIIIKRNGDEVEVKVLYITDNDVSYKKWSNQDGPTYTTAIGDIFMIKYSNGDKDVFDSKDIDKNSSQLKNEDELAPRLIEKEAAANNQSLIDSYNGLKVVLNGKGNGKKAGGLITILEVSNSSILSNEDLEISITKERFFYGGNYSIDILNKTEKTLYIDKANCFRISNDGTYSTYYSAKQTSVSTGTSQSVGVALGGIANLLGIGGVVGQLANSISVGGSSHEIVTESYTEQRILAIPPHSKANFAVSEKYKVNSIKFDDEKFDADTIVYNEDNTVCSKNYIFTYSDDEKFSTFSAMKFCVYVNRIIFMKGVKSQKWYDETFPGANIDIWDSANDGGWGDVFIGDYCVREGNSGCYSPK